MSEVQEDELFSGVDYLLWDRQVHVEKKTEYVHWAIEFHNSEGVEEHSQISVDYDPGYQKVIFHSAKIIREGEEIDKLGTTAVQTFQRETDMERHIYDGTETALLNFSDVRKGDVLDYSYSVVGRNPIYPDLFFGTSYLGTWYPVSELHLEFLAASNRKFNFKGQPEEVKINKVQEGKLTRYSYQKNRILPPNWEGNVPGWINLYPRVEVSEIRSWGEVAAWAETHFKIGPKDQKTVEEFLASEFEPPMSHYEYGTELTKWVQEEIRYMGLESGIGGYKPRAPSKVLQDRFGDCKDKSLLLSTMLQQHGLAAFPMLVHTSGGELLPNSLPSPLAFNHCVVFVEILNDTFVVDPTINMQGGLFTEMWTPDYGYGLVIRPGERSLTKLHGNGEYKLEFTSKLKVGPAGEPIEMEVKTNYHGGAADETRRSIAAFGEKEWGKICLDFYRQFYEDVQPLQNLDLAYRDTLGQNTLTVTESYAIGDFWQVNPEVDNSIWLAELVPLEILDYFHQNSVSGRELPFSLMYPLDLQHQMIIEMEDFTPVPKEIEHISGPGFEFKSSSMPLPGRNILQFNYRHTKPFIEADSVAKFYTLQEEIVNNIGFYIQIPKTGAGAFSGGKYAWLRILLIALSFAAMVYAYWRWGYRYDPKPKIPENISRTIGGWIILPIIGLFLSCIVSLVNIFSPDVLFPELILRMVLGQKTLLSDPAYGLFGIFQSLYSIGLPVMLIGNLILVFKRRSAAPMLMAVLYTGNLLFLVLYTVLASYFNGQGYSLEHYSIGNWGGAVIGIALWTPLFLFSHRSHGTFVTTLKNHLENTSAQPPIQEGHEAAGEEE